MVTSAIVPPFTEESALSKVQMAEDLWNMRDPERVVLSYTEDSEWRNRTEFLKGRKEILAFLRRKWARELDYRLGKTLWGFRQSRMAVKFHYEWHDDSGLGSGVTATNCGSSLPTGLCGAVKPASTICQSAKEIACCRNARCGAPHVGRKDCVTGIGGCFQQ
jgi:hypothetical protein